MTIISHPNTTNLIVLRQQQPQEPQFKAQTNKPHYKDPLLAWPTRGLAYSNELGAALSEVSPKLGTLLWVPALMYFGADIYDKYKNDKTSYDPSSHRALEQAIFQACSSVVLPTAAIHLGQKTASALNKFNKDGLTTQAKEEAIQFTQDYMAQEKLYKYADNIPQYKANFNSALETSISAVKGEPKKFFGSKKLAALSKANSEKLINYTNSEIDKIFSMRDELMKNKRPKDISKKIFKKFVGIQADYKAQYGEDYMAHAAKYAIRKYQENKIFKQKMIKTLGGFAALALLIKPIDMFVEKMIMKKVVEPGLSKISKK